MDDEEIREDVVEEKPKTKKTTKPKKTTATNKSSKTASAKKTKKPAKKKATSTARKKKVVEDDISQINQPNSVSVQPEMAQSKVIMKNDFVKGSESQSQGQAVISKLKVEVVNKKENTVNSIPNLSSNESTESNVSNVTSNIMLPVISANSRVETTQSQVLPFAAIKVRNIVGKIINLTAEIICNKVIVQGTVHEQVFFVGTDNIVHHLADDVHFSTFLDIPGVQPGMNAQVTGIIEEIIPELAPDGLSLVKKIIVEVFVKVTETVQLALATGKGPTLLLKQVVGENSEQLLVETDLSLFTPAIKIDEIVGKIQDITVETICDKVIIQGIIHKQIFFIDTNNQGRHQAEDIPFSLFVDIPGAAPGMDVQVSPNIEAIFFKLITPTVVRQKVVMEFFVKVTQNVIQCVEVGDGPLIKAEQFIGENTVQELSETVLTLNTPAIKVREIIAQLRNLVTNVICNKVIVQGIIHKQIFFIGIDNVERHQAEDIPFSLFLDVPGVNPGDNIHLSTKIEAIFFELETATILRQKVIFAVTAFATQELQINLVICPNGTLFKLEKVIGENTKQVLIVRREEIVSPVIPIKPVVTKITIVSPGEAVTASQQKLVQNTVQLPVTAIKVKEVNANITDVAAQIIPEGVLVEGIVNKTVVFVGNDNVVRTVNEQVPFTILVNIPGITPSQITNVSVMIEDIIFTLDPTGTAVNQTIVLKATVEAQESVQAPITVVTNVSGPDIMQTKVRVQGLVQTPSGAVFQEFDVVTDVSGLGIIGVTKQTVLLQKVGDAAPTPITVVTDVQLEDP